jgi:hypothetical protein
MTPTTTTPQPRRLSTETVAAILLACAGWVFSAGLLWQKVDDLEKKVDRIERFFELPTRPQADSRREP